MNFQDPDQLEVSATSSPDERPIVVFGGSFDPPHSRHVALLAGADRLLRAKRIVVIPAWANPQRSDSPRASPADRVAMCTLAFEELADTTISTVEIDQQKPCFTVDTLELLHQQQRSGDLPSGKFRLLVGSDQALNFKTWKNWERILDLATPAVVLRPPHERWEWPNLLAEIWDQGWTAKWLTWTLPIDPVNVSSTEIRQRAAQGLPMEDLVPSIVATYITSRKLYGAS